MTVFTVVAGARAAEPDAGTVSPWRAEIRAHVVTDLPAPELEPQLTACVEERVAAAAPAGEAAAKPVIEKAAFDCGKELGELLATAPGWTASTAWEAIYAASCTRGKGPKWAGWCQCFSKQARKQFKSPAEWTRVDRAKPAELTKDDQQRAARMGTACGKLIPRP